MRVGVVGSVLAILAGGAAGGALYMRDQAALQKAQQLREGALAKLSAGELDGARSAFDEAAEAAVQVGGLTGRRPQALALADEARRWSLVLQALAHADQEPREALLQVQGETTWAGGELPAQLKAVVARVEAGYLLDAALALEARDDVERSPKLFQAAIEAGEAAGSPRVEEAKRGLGRAAVRRALVQAEAAVRAQRDAEAEKRAGEVSQGLEAGGDAFRDQEREEIEQRVQAVRAELADRRALQDYDQRVRALAARVSTSELGELLPEVQRLQPPSLQGQHPRAEGFAKQLAELEQLRQKMLKAAQDFQGMVLASRSGSRLVFLDAHEATNADFAAFLAKNSDQRAPRTWLRGELPAGQERYPVSGVSPAEAQAYAAWRGKRLPSLQEWRAATVRGDQDFPWGAGWKPNTANLREAGVGATREVGSYPAGKGCSGALDLIGNVREIVTTPDGFQAVGGSYRTDAPRSSAQSDGVALTERTRFSDVGFRCAKELTWNE